MLQVFRWSEKMSDNTMTHSKANEIGLFYFSISMNSHMINSHIAITYEIHIDRANLNIQLQKRSKLKWKILPSLEVISWMSLVDGAIDGVKLFLQVSYTVCIEEVLLGEWEEDEEEEVKLAIENSLWKNILLLFLKVVNGFGRWRWKYPLLLLIVTFFSFGWWCCGFVYCFFNF